MNKIALVIQLEVLYYFSNQHIGCEDCDYENRKAWFKACIVKEVVE